MYFYFLITGPRYYSIRLSITTCVYMWMDEWMDGLMD